jgi:hypothetical protein
MDPEQKGLHSAEKDTIIQHVNDLNARLESADKLSSRGQMAMDIDDSDEADDAETKATYESVKSRTISGGFVCTGFCDEDPDAEALEERM